MGHFCTPIHTWFRGVPDQAVRCSEEAIEYARALGHGPTLAWGLAICAKPAAIGRDVAVAERLATEVMELSIDQRSPLDLAWAQVAAGWAIGKRGELDRGISTLCEGLSYLSSAYLYMRPIHLALLAELYIDNGRINEAVVTIESAICRVSDVDERMFEAEILRLEAALCLHTNPKGFEQVETLLLESIEVARQQEAKSLELRSSVALGELWKQQDKRREAHNLLAPIYEWFTEGFDTPDLKEAKALLDELS